MRLKRKKTNENQKNKEEFVQNPRQVVKVNLPRANCQCVFACLIILGWSLEQHPIKLPERSPYTYLKFMNIRLNRSQEIFLWTILTRAVYSYYAKIFSFSFDAYRLVPAHFIPFFRPFLLIWTQYLRSYSISYSVHLHSYCCILFFLHFCTRIPFFSHSKGCHFAF